MRSLIIAAVATLAFASSAYATTGNHFPGRQHSPVTVARHHTTGKPRLTPNYIGRTWHGRTWHGQQ